MKNCFCALVVTLGAALSVRAALPKVMIMVDEKAIGSVSTSEIETMAVKKLADKRIETVDQNMVQNNLERIQKAFRGAGDNRAAAAMGREFGADVILIGEAVAKPNAAKIGETNLRSYMATVSFRAVRIDNSVNIATASDSATVVAMDDLSGSSRALKAAGAKALDTIATEIVAKWKDPSDVSAKKGQKTTVELTVGGMDQIWKLKATRMCLKGNKKNIASVVQKSYAQGVAIFRVESLLPAEELAEELVMHPPEELKFQVVEIRPAVLSLRVVEAPAPKEDEE